MWDKELLKEWNELESIIGLAQLEKIRAYVGRLLVRIETITESRDAWRAKYNEKRIIQTPTRQPDNI